MTTFEEALARVERELEAPLGGNVEYYASDIHIILMQLKASLKDTQRLDFVEQKIDYWAEMDASGEPYLVAHTWEVQKNCLMIAAQKATLRQAIDDERRASISP